LGENDGEIVKEKLDVSESLDWQLILEEEKVLCWSASLQLGFFSQLHHWALGDSFKSREVFYWSQWTRVLGIAPGLEGIKEDCFWEPWLKAWTPVWEAGQKGGMSCVWIKALSVNWKPLPCWVPSCLGCGGHRGEAGGGKDECVCGQRNPLVLDLIWVPDCSDLWKLGLKLGSSRCWGSLK